MAQPFQTEIMTPEEKDAILRPIWEILTVTMEACGSRVTCNPPPMDTDEDYLVLIADLELPKLQILLHEQGWVLGGEEDYDKIPMAIGICEKNYGFESWTKAHLNLIITTSAAFWDRHQAATHVCKMLNLMDKQQRVALFEAVLYGAKYEPESDA